jgi:hypothetical protein
VDLDSHIMQVLGAMPKAARPVTIGDLARRFGVSPGVVLPAARRLVDTGLARAALVDVHGVPTLRGLLPLSPVAPEAGVAADPDPGE